MAHEGGLMKVSEKLPSSGRRPGFTLVELVVVIVVIAILASIAVISYRDVQSRVAETVLQSDLRNAGNQLEMGKTQYGNYTENSSDLAKSPGTEYSYESDAKSGYYCLEASSVKSPKSFYISSESKKVREGTCPGQDDSSNGGGNETPVYTITKGPIAGVKTLNNCSTACGGYLDISLLASSSATQIKPGDQFTAWFEYASSQGPTEHLQAVITSSSSKLRMKPHDGHLFKPGSGDWLTQIQHGGGYLSAGSNRSSAFDVKLDESATDSEYRITLDTTGTRVTIIDIYSQEIILTKQ